MTLSSGPLSNPLKVHLHSTVLHIYRVISVHNQTYRLRGRLRAHRNPRGASPFCWLACSRMPSEFSRKDYRWTPAMPSRMRPGLQRPSKRMQRTHLRMCWDNGFSRQGCEGNPCICQGSSVVSEHASSRCVEPDEPVAWELDDVPWLDRPERALGQAKANIHALRVEGTILAVKH